jgi:ectoine hydroxylase-related dioxygenase (phytanoyl-CoA dioxygenase family)
MRPSAAVSVAAGQAVILDDATVHYSPPNLTADRRLAIQLVMVPEEADALWHQQVGGDDDRVEVDVWKVEPGWFFELWDGVGDPAHGELVDRLDLPAPRYALDTLRAVISGA